MRGRTLVLILAAGAVIFFAFALWYFGSQSTPDDRFNLNRQPIPTEAGESLLFAALSEDYKPHIDQRLTAVELGHRAGGATYSNGTNVITVFVHSMDFLQVNDVLDGQSQFRSAECDNAQASVILHPSPPMPFRYSVCPNQEGSKIVYEFAWVNGNWFIRATGTNSEALVHFVNLYPF